MKTKKLLKQAKGKRESGKDSGGTNPEMGGGKTKKQCSEWSKENKEKVGKIKEAKELPEGKSQRG